MDFEAIQLLPTSFIVSFAAVLGLVFGSFFNVCIERYISGESLVYPPSHCPECKTTLRPWELVPIVSWIALRGRCAHCHAPISIQNPLVELVTCAAFSLLAYRYELSWNLAVLLLFTSIFIVASGIDFKIFILPDPITLGSAIPAFACSVWGLGMPWQESLAGGLVGAGLFWLVMVAFKKLRGVEGLGFGDVKLMLPIGFLCGIAMLPMAVMLSGILALCWMIPLHLMKGGDIRKRRVPFGPFLSLGAWITLIWGDELLSWWLSIIL